MTKFAVYMIGLLLVVAAGYVLLTQTGVSAYVPAGIILVALLLLLGLGIMGGSQRIDNSTPTREIVETRQQVGDTEVRRSKLQ